VYDQGDADLPYIVMEYVDGPSLREVLGERGRLDAAEVLALIEPVCRALDPGARRRGRAPRHQARERARHGRRHGRSSPTSASPARSRRHHHTQTGALIGSVHYVAPSSSRGAASQPPRTSTAVGVLLFELLTGRKPLPAETPMAVALRHGREPIPAPSEHVEVSPALDEVVATATALDPADRYDDMGAFIAALQAAVPEGPSPVVVSRHDEHGGDRTLVIPPSPDTDLATFPPVGTASARPKSTEDAPGTPDGGQPKRSRKARKAEGKARNKAEKAGRKAEKRAAKAAHTRSRGRSVVLWSSVVLLVLLLAAGGAAATWHYVIAPIQQVPSLDGVHEAEARETLAALGLELDVTGTRDDRSVAEGAILEQDPPPGTELRSGETVSVVLSGGPSTVTMPTVTNLPLEEATELLEGEPYFFTIARVDESHSDTVPAGIVIGQAPSADVELRQDAEVLLHISLGIEQVVVPDLSELDRDAAEAALTEAQLTFDFSEEYSDAVPTRGQVISQSLEAGVEVDKGTAVSVVVSKGALTIPVPNVRGKPIDTAVAELRALDLDPRVITQPIPRIGPFRRGEAGLVEEQSPPPGQDGGIRRGQTIDLYTFVEDADEDDEDDDD
jgi:eukaryotic-like serine/threonine-protein kinase